MSLFLLIQFVSIILKITYTEEKLLEIIYLNEECKRNMENDPNYITYLNDSNSFLLETLRGKIQLEYNETYLNNCDIEIIKRINKNIPCPYSLKQVKSTKNITKGIFLGAGINLLNFNEEEVRKILNNSTMKINVKRRYYELFTYIYNSNKTKIDLTKPLEDIDLFNEAFIKSLIKRFNDRNKESKDIDKKYKTAFINSILPIYIQLYNGDDVLKKYLTYTVAQASYIIEHLYEIFPYQRLIQSKICMLDGNIKYNNNHIFFIVPTHIFDNNDIYRIKVTINWFHEYFSNYNLNSNRISLLAVDKDNNFSNYIIDYNSKKDDLDKFFKNDYIDRNEYIDLEKIYENLNTKFEESKNLIFENKIAVLILNFDSIIDKEANNIIEQAKKDYNIQTIPIINNANKKNEKNEDIFKYNIFYNFTEKINFNLIRLAISNMHIYFNMEKKDEIEYKNLNNNDIDVPMYVEVDVDKHEKDFDYYEISLDIYKTSGYNIFVSDSNPYPNIKNYVSKFLKYENNNNPKIRINAKEIDKIYIGIEGTLTFDIKIKKIKTISSTNLSDGDYDYINYNTQVKFSDNRLFYTFGSDYIINSTIFNNESSTNLMKYFSRGIDLVNTIDHSFFDFELFLYLYGKTLLINRVYRDQENNYYFGRYIKITDCEPIDLKNDGFSRLTINKIYPFLGINELNDSAPSITFNENEIQNIYNITYQQYIDELNQKLKKYPTCIPFEKQSPTKKFILFCLYFSYYYDSHINKNIIELSSNSPKYSEVINYLKKKQDDNSLFINMIKQMEQEDKLEKIMVSIIMGKSLLINDNIGVNFIKDFYNIMSKSRTKISVSLYDVLKFDNNIENIIPFSSNADTEPEDLNKYNEIPIEERIKYNDTEQNMDFDKILKYGLLQFSKYDGGIKKIIIILCDENIYTKDNILINNILVNISNDKNMELIENQIDILILTSKNYEKGEIHNLFKTENNKENDNKISIYSLYDNYFHVNNLRNTSEFMIDLERLIKNSVIKMKVDNRFINDFFQGKISYYKIYSLDNPGNTIVIRTNISNFKFYFSYTHPFPNSYNGIIPIYSKEGDSIYISNDENSDKNSVYLGIESINSVGKQIIEIFTCESYDPLNNCKFIYDYTDIWYIFFSVFFGFILLIIIYKCKIKFCSDLKSKEKKRINVFDHVK